MSSWAIVAALLSGCPSEGSGVAANSHGAAERSRHFASLAAPLPEGTATAAWRQVLAPGKPGPLLAMTEIVVAVSPSGNVAALETESGQRRWFASVGGTVAGACAVGNFVYVPVAQPALVILGLDDGREIWRLSLRESVTVAPACTARFVVIAGDDGDLRAYTVVDRRLAWVHRTAPRPRAPVVIGSTVIAREAQAELVALDLATGQRRWGTSVPVDIASGPLATSAGIIVLLDTHGSMHAIKTSDGTRSWSLSGTTTPAAALAAAGDRVLVAAESGLLTAVDIHHGRRLWQQLLPSAPSAPPIIAGDAALVATSDRSLLAFSLGDGRLLARAFLPSTAAELVVSDGHLVYIADNGDIIGLP